MKSAEKSDAGLSRWDNRLVTPKSSHRPDDERDERIAMEIIVDAYGPEEQAMAWYYYLEEKPRFPL